MALADDAVVTMVRALGRHETLQVRRHDGQAIDAELVGWDPATSLAVLRAPGWASRRRRRRTATPRVGAMAVAVARSWSNAVTASAGIIAIIGGPLPTGRRRSIEQVFRTTAPMHDGFAGGAFVGASGSVLGITTAAAIRGFGVVIPAPIAWRAASEVLKHGRPRRGYLGIAGQPVELAERQRGGHDRSRGVLIVGLTPGGPAEAGGVMVGDILIAFDGQPVSSPEDLLDLLTADRVGRQVPAAFVRGGQPLTSTWRSRSGPRRRMDVLLVGTVADRARLRAILPDSVHIVAETATLEDARADDHGVDAWIVSPTPRRRHAENGDPIETLTPREHEVLDLLAEGFPNKEIARRLGISDQTAKFHVASICGKLGASNRTEAVRIALRHGLVAIRPRTEGPETKD